MLGLEMDPRLDELEGGHMLENGQILQWTSFISTWAFEFIWEYTQKMRSGTTGIDARIDQFITLLLRL